MLPPEFLSKIADNHNLQPLQKEAFVALFSQSDNNLIKAAQAIHVGESAFRNRMTRVYQKFHIGGDASGKANVLRIWLLGEFAKEKSREKSSVEYQQDDIGTRIEEVRSKVSRAIEKQCGSMRVLDMEQPITVDSIYTQVKILEKKSRRQDLSIDELLEQCGSQDADRFSLSGIHSKSRAGIDVVQQHDKLLVLGKPGAGKTTFLKWLAIRCNAGRLYADRVPVFVPLKEFAEKEEQPTLIRFIAQHWSECGIEDAEAVANQILLAGRALLLLDGLDEVRIEHHDRVLEAIHSTANQFDANPFVVTCRIAAQEYTFETFTEVEIADFNRQQIKQFVQRWFEPKNSAQAGKFLSRLKQQTRLEELASSPLLLTLLCLVFEERNRFPKNRVDLYEEGLEVLLRRWDASRNINRKDILPDWSAQDTVKLLSQVAFTMFDRGDYFFRQTFLEEEIQAYLRHRQASRPNPSSAAVLKEIEAQHGLLIERSRRVYSFSHLTFQEYFTARWMRENSEEGFSGLIGYLTEKRWREVFLLTVEMLNNADEMLQAMKQSVDQILAQDEDLQQYLSWAEGKSRSVQAPYKPTAIRAFYLNYYDFLPRLDRSLSRALAWYHEPAIDPEVDREVTAAIAAAHHEEMYPDVASRSNRTPKKSDSPSIPDAPLDWNIALDFDLVMLFHQNFEEIQGELFYRDVYNVTSYENEPLLSREFADLAEQIPYRSEEDWERWVEWWRSNGDILITQLRAAAIKYRNVGHDRQFSDEQRELLEKYYSANRLMIDCLHSNCRVTPKVRREIEATLFLPIAAIRPQLF